MAGPRHILAAFAQPTSWTQKVARQSETTSATCRGPSRTVVRANADRSGEKRSLFKKFADFVDNSGTVKFSQLPINEVQGQWARHRSRARHLRNALGIPTSDLVSRVAPMCTFVGLEAAAISLYSHTSSTPLPHLSTVPFSLMTGVLALLLVFRTNASYERFVEARIAWGTLVNRSRDLVRMTLVAMETPAQRQMVRYTAAFCFCLKDHLRGAKSEVLEAPLKELLSKEELRSVMTSAHRPNAVAMLLSASIASDQSVERNMRNKLQEQIAILIDVLGMSERILRTPIPLSYTRHTSRFCIPWCVAMPFLLAKDLGGVGSVVASVLITFAMLGIEDIGVNLEDPFRVLPLNAICNTIKNNVFEIFKNKEEAAACVQLTRDAS